MAKQGMKRPEISHTRKYRRTEHTVQEIGGKAKNTDAKARPIISGTKSPSLKVYHSRPHGQSKKEKPISDAYPEIDSDLARDNLQNDIPEADLQDLN